MRPEQQLARAIARSFRKHVLDECVARIRHCVGLLDEADAWRKPSPHGNSVANLLMHLAGNVRQWILSGIAGQPDARDRPREFAATAGQTGVTAAELMDRLEATVREAVAVVDGLDAESLLASYRFQGRYDGDGVGGVLHVLEHFSGHAAQIYAYTKQVRGIDLRFWDL